MELEYNASKKISKRAQRLLSEITSNKTPFGKFYQFTIAISSVFITLSLLMLIVGSNKAYKDFPFYVICLGAFIQTPTLRELNFFGIARSYESLRVGVQVAETNRGLA